MTLTDGGECQSLQSSDSSDSSESDSDSDRDSERERESRSAESCRLVSSEE